MLVILCKGYAIILENKVRIYKRVLLYIAKCKKGTV